MKNENEKTFFAERLALAMKAKGYDSKPSVLEREFNLNYSGKPMTLHGVRKWLIGESIPSGDKLLTLAKWLDVPLEELVFEKDIQKAIERRDSKWTQELGYKDKEVFEAFINLSPSNKKLVRELIVALSNQHTK
ncbi:XRE family transcriptional regulator [Acinetobacter bereziniae]|jgi:transcriptional regulator with XRE-family HTH domain|uniref:XRE family transcriptional regulator n=1 Tax=Acinetobacter bereziniae TaxID=106648 RepID=UPI0021CF0D16|nr:XRE family transcriptional regulator [Acinetobacter bereziniae]MCU4598486.1 XRE family transcriptional regulator [Acinetobacter bereziniae]